MKQLLLKHIPIVLLILWVALCFFWQPPWIMEDDIATELRHRNQLVPGQLLTLSEACRDRIEQRMRAYPMADEERALVESLVLADRRGLKRDQREAFTDAGAMHVLAVSGLHVGIVCGIAVWLLTLGGGLFIPWERRGLRIAHRLAIIAVVWGYVFITGFTVSVVRSAVMFSLMPLGQHTLSSTRYNRLAFAALLILFINPHCLYSPSFLLSFSAVLAMLYFLPFWQERLRTYLPLHRAPKPIRPIAEYGTGLVTSSLAAQIGVLPWTLLFFGQSANYFILTNLIVLPLAPILLVLSFLTIGCVYLPFLAPLASLFSQGLEWVAWIMNAGVRWVQHLPGATSFFTFTPLMTALLILLIICSSAFIRTKARRKYLYLLLAVCLAVALLFTYAKTIRSYVAVESALSLLSPS